MCTNFSPCGLSWTTEKAGLAPPPFFCRLARFWKLQARNKVYSQQERSLYTIATTKLWDKDGQTDFAVLGAF